MNNLLSIMVIVICAVFIFIELPFILIAGYWGINSIFDWSNRQYYYKKGASVIKKLLMVTVVLVLGVAVTYFTGFREQNVSTIIQYDVEKEHEVTDMLIRGVLPNKGVLRLEIYDQYEMINIMKRLSECSYRRDLMKMTFIDGNDMLDIGQIEILVMIDGSIETYYIDEHGDFEYKEQGYKGTSQDEKLLYDELLAMLEKQ